MHVVFVHQNDPAQFGHLARELVQRHGFRCTFVTQQPTRQSDVVERIGYRPRGGATKATHPLSRSFENAIAHSHGVYAALKARPDIRPDLVVGHSGFGSTAFLRELFPAAAIVNYFEYFYRSFDSDLDFRPDFPPRELDRLRTRSRNATILLDLENCDVGYCPTHWQRDRFPPDYHNKLRVVFDGIDTAIWQPRPDTPREIGGHHLPVDMKIVTYVARGMESIRGFDIFMRFAKRLAARRPDVLFVVAGQDRVCYGGDVRITGSKSFKDWVLAQDDYDTSRFLFTGLLPPRDLARLFSHSDLHIYLTVPFVLSWSLLNALACGAIVLASDIAPVREVIQDGRTGLLAGFFDIEGLVERAEAVLTAPADYRHLRENGIALIREKYCLEVCLPQILAVYREACNRAREFRGPGW